RTFPQSQWQIWRALRRASKGWGGWQSRSTAPRPAAYVHGGGAVVALKKSDLYSSLWKSCDELRGGMDATQYKDYILTLLFVKYVTDKANADPGSLIEVPKGGSFDDM